MSRRLRATVYGLARGGLGGGPSRPGVQAATAPPPHQKIYIIFCHIILYHTHHIIPYHIRNYTSHITPYHTISEIIHIISYRTILYHTYQFDPPHPGQAWKKRASRWRWMTRISSTMDGIPAMSHNCVSYFESWDDTFPGEAVDDSLPFSQRTAY